MKVGIVTQPLYNNYGGVLQNFALQKALKSMGHDPVTLDYLPSLSFGRYLLYVGKNVLRSVVPSKRKTIKAYHHFIVRPKVFQDFIDRNIAVTRPMEKYARKVLKRNGLDAVMVGSDQVWRKEYNACIEDMFLAFTEGYECRRVAYAASFGVEKWNYPENLTVSCRDLASRFDRISVREESGRRLCREYLGTAVEVVPDPTLLLTADDYLPLLEGFTVPGGRYLSAYVLDMTEKKRAFIESLAASTGAEIRIMSVSDTCGCSIEEWLMTIRNSCFVVTDSFHGSVFSILFNRPFVAFVNKERGADRFTTLFGALGLSSRLVDPDDGIPCGFDMDMDYSDVNAGLNRLREVGRTFIKESLK